MFSAKSGNKSGMERSYRIPLHCRAVLSSQHLHHLVAPLGLNRLSGFPQSQIYSAVARWNSIYRFVCFTASQPPALLHGNAGREDITYSFLWKTDRLLPNCSQKLLLSRPYPRSINLSEMITEANSELNKCCLHDIICRKKSLPC